MKKWNDKNWITSESRIQQQNSLEKKKNLIEKLSKKKSATVTINTPSVVEPLKVDSTKERVDIEKFCSISFGMGLFADDGKTSLKPVSALEEIASYLLHVIKTNSTQTLLLWPGSLKSLGLAHAIATMTRWSQGDKQGIRTLLYPAKANFLHALNHAHVNRSDLIKLAQNLAESNSRKNNMVTVSLPSKDPFWLSLNGIQSDPDEGIHPSIAELLPHFFADKDFSNWKSCDGDLLRHIKARLNRKHRKVLSNETIPELSDFDTAPDAILAISWKSSQNDINAALRQIQDARKLDIIVIDATRSLRKDNPSWKKKIVRFIDSVYEIFQESSPPVLFVIDEPHIQNQLRKEFESRFGKKNKLTAFIPAEDSLQGIICSVSGEGVIPKDQIERFTPSPRNIDISITDTDAAEAILLIDNLRSDITEEAWVKILNDTANYLSRLAALPSSTRALINWLNEADVPMAVRDNYSWPVYRSRLEQMLHDPIFGERTRLQRVIDRGNDLWRNYENGTPLARKLADLIEEHTRGTEKCCVAFTRPTARRLAERYFETYDGYPEGAGFEVLRDCVRFVVSRSLESESELNSNETLILAGLDEESLRLLLLDDRFRSPVYVLLTRRNAAYLKATLKTIRRLPAFENLSARVDMLLRQLPDFPEFDKSSVFNRADFVLPTFSFEQGLSSITPESEDQDPDAWEIILEDDSRVRRNPQAHMYIYDPTQSHTQNKGFVSVQVSKLQEGDRLFLMSFELREQTEVALKEAGIQISNDKGFENDLRLYHQQIGELVAKVPGSTLSEQARYVFAQMQLIDSNIQMPTEGTLRNWLDVERFSGVSFEDAQPGAPRHEAHYKAFTKSLGLEDFESIYFWKAVIQPLRGVRRADGRRVSDAYTDILLEPESAIVHRRIKPATVNMLFSRAKENLHVIECIRKPLEDALNE